MDEQIQSTGESQVSPVSFIDLSVGSIISNGFSKGFKYLFLYVGSLILWFITLWIPYLNIGTTIGLYGLIVKMSKDEKFSFGEIFRKDYRSLMPDFFLLLALMTIALPFAYAFVIIPGIVLGITWLLSYYFLIDKKLSAFQALSASAKATYGFKWDIFGGLFILFLIHLVLMIIIWLIFKEPADEFSALPIGISTLSVIGWIIFIVIGLIFYSIYAGAISHIYKELSKRA